MLTDVLEQRIEILKQRTKLYITDDELSRIDELTKLIEYIRNHISMKEYLEEN